MEIAGGNLARPKLISARNGRLPRELLDVPRLSGSRNGRLPGALGCAKTTGSTLMVLVLAGGYRYREVYVISAYHCS